MEEVTPQEINEEYKNIKSYIIKNYLESIINFINKQLTDGAFYMVENDGLYIHERDISNKLYGQTTFPEDCRDNLLKFIPVFYKNWDIETEAKVFKFTPKQPFDKEIKKIKIQEQEIEIKEVGINIPINNRWEIMQFK